jgi:hypothetical protein
MGYLTKNCCFVGYGCPLAPDMLTLGLNKPWLKEVWTSATKHVLISKVGTEIICTYVHLSYHVYVPCYLFFVLILWSWLSYQLWYIIILSICEKYTVNIVYIYIHQYNIYIWLWFRLIYYQSLFIILWSDYDSICITVIFLFIYDTPTDSQQNNHLRSGRHDGTHRLQSMEPWRVHRSHSDVIISNILNTR